MKKYMHILMVFLMSLMLTVGTDVAAAAPAGQQTHMTAAQKKRAKEKAKRDKARAKEKAKREKEKAKKEAAREKVELTKAGGDRQLAAKTKAAADRIAAKTVYHHIAIWGGAGYSGLLAPKGDNVVGNPELGTNFLNDNLTLDPRFVGGGGGMIGFGYELHHKKFMFKVGPEFRILSSQTKFDYSAPLDLNRVDYPAQMTQHYDLSGVKENQTVGQLMVPIMFGGNFNKVYFMAGAKVGYTLLHEYKQGGTMTTSVTDRWALGDWGQMATHSLEKGSIPGHSLYQEGGNKDKFDMGVDVAVSAEVGINLNEFLSDEWNSRNEERRFPWRMRIAAFVDYGLPLTKVGGEKELVYRSGAVNNGAEMLASNAMYDTHHVSGKMSSLLVGVKFTALIQLNKPKSPDPFICFLVTDTLGNKTRTPASISVSDVKQKNRKARIRKMNKEGKLDVRYPRGQYQMFATANGYLPSHYLGDTLLLDHIEDGDSAIFRLIPVPALVTYVKDKETGNRIAAKVEYIDLANTTYNAAGEVNGETPHKVSLHYGDRYLVRVSAPNYHPDSMTISNLTDTIDVTMRPIHRQRHKLVLKHMYFAVDKTEILPGSEEDIEKLYNFLVDNPRIRVIITGHTDSDGDDHHNQILSEGRAASLRNLMIERGIDAARLESEGKGESEPIDTNATAEGKQNNRRIEVTVLNEDEAEEDVW